MAETSTSNNPHYLKKKKKGTSEFTTKKGETDTKVLNLNCQNVLCNFPLICQDRCTPFDNESIELS